MIKYIIFLCNKGLMVIFYLLLGNIYKAKYRDKVSLQFEWTPKLFISSFMFTNNKKRLPRKPKYKKNVMRGRGQNV